MRVALIGLLSLAACEAEPTFNAEELAAQVEALPDPRVGAPFAVTLTASSFIPGRLAQLSVTGAPPNAQVYFLKSEAGPGAGPCHPSYPACAGVRGPLAVLGNAAPILGAATITYNVPANAVAPQWLQAFVAIPALGRASTSNIVLRVPDDADGDYFPASIDNCPDLANPNQLDIDNDGVGAACDCDDNSVLVGAGSPEIPGNLDDEDCDGVALDPWVGPYSGNLVSEVNVIFFTSACDGSAVFDVGLGDPATITGSASCFDAFYGVNRSFTLAGSTTGGAMSGTITDGGAIATFSGVPAVLGGLRQVTLNIDGSLDGSPWTGEINAAAPLQ